MNYDQSLIFSIAYLVLIILALLFTLINIASIRKANKCNCQYDWGKIINGEKYPRCVHCNETFKLIKQ